MLQGWEMGNRFGYRNRGRQERKKETSFSNPSIQRDSNGGTADHALSPGELISEYMKSMS